MLEHYDIIDEAALLITTIASNAWLTIKDVNGLI